VKALQRDHDIALTAIPERTWTQFYIRRLGPKEAAAGLREGGAPESWGTFMLAIYCFESVRQG
jgi:hypothetical protein